MICVAGERAEIRIPFWSAELVNIFLYVWENSGVHSILITHLHWISSRRIQKICSVSFKSSSLFLNVSRNRFLRLSERIINAMFPKVIICFFSNSSSHSGHTVDILTTLCLFWGNLSWETTELYRSASDRKMTLKCYSRYQRHHPHKVVTIKT